MITVLGPPPRDVGLAPGTAAEGRAATARPRKYIATVVAFCSTKTNRKISTIAAMMEVRSRYRQPG
jgi:hypothetical protein